jgi:hypothetical protein
MDERLMADRFPRASGYHPEWVLASASSAARPTKEPLAHRAAGYSSLRLRKGQ